MNWDSLRSFNFITPLAAVTAWLPSEMDLPAADDEVHQLLKHFGFLQSMGHLDQAIQAHTTGDWAAANGQTRTFIESLFEEIAFHVDAAEAATLGSWGDLGFSA